MAAIPLVPYEGMNYLLNAGLKAGSAISHWYVGLIGSNTYVPALADTLSGTLASMSEPATAFGTTRPELTSTTVTSGVYTATAAPVEFTNSSGGNQTIYGVFVCSNPTVASGTGTLLGVYMFAASKVIANGDILRVPLTLPLSN